MLAGIAIGITIGVLFYPLLDWVDVVREQRAKRNKIRQFGGIDAEIMKETNENT